MFRRILGLCLVMGVGVTAQARELFVLDVSVATAGGGVVENRRVFDTFEEIIEVLDDDGLRETSAAYDAEILAGRLPATDTDISFRGLPISATWAAGSPFMLLEVPDLGFSRSFEGATRDESEDLLEDFLESNGEDLLGRILRRLVETTPIDPVAGNPSSLTAQMVSSDFAIGTNVGAENSSSASGEEDAESPNLLGVGARFGRFTADDFDANVANIDLTYTVPLADPRWAVIVDFPMTYVDTEGAATYAGSLGVGFRIPVLPSWSVTPTVRTGATGSVDLGSLAAVYSGSLVSDVGFDVGSMRLSIGNSVTYLQTIGDLEVAGYTFDYDLSNIVFRNGIELEGSLGREAFGLPATWQVSAANTHFTGDKVYIENYTDLAFSFGTKAGGAGLDWDSLRLGATYTFGQEGYRGLRVNFGYQF